MTKMSISMWLLASIGALAIGCSDDGLGGVGAGGDAGSSGTESAGELTAGMSTTAGMTATAGMSASASGADTSGSTADDGLDDTGGRGSTSDAGDASSTGSADPSTSDGGTTDGGTTDGGTTDGGGSSSDDGESSSGGMPQVEGFGDCVNNPPGSVCLPQEQCITDLAVPPTQGVCTDPECTDASDCPLAPPGGTAPVICTDVTGEGINECIIACGLGGTCPTGMICALGLACAWPAS